MKQYRLHIATALALAIAPVYAATPYFSIRSQGVNAARELVGWQNQINQPYKEESYASLTITPEYTHSFRTGALACCLFSPHITSCTCPIITISGNTMPNRGAQDWLADYFGLPSMFKSRMHFDPCIKNITFDLNLFVGFDGKKEGLFFRIHTPLTHTSWALNFSESIDQKSVDSYLAGYFGPVAVTRDFLQTNASQFFADGEAPDLGTITFNPLTCSKFSKCALTKTRLADIELALGKNFKLDEDYHFGLALRGSIPTGNKPEGTYFFEPIVGSGGHWKVGLGVTGDYCLWRDEEADRSLGFWYELNLQHLFKAKQCRTFDLCNKPNSRYMLAEKLGSNTQNLQSNGILSTYQFAKEFIPLANVTTKQVKVSAALEADLLLKFSYTHDCIQWDLGYEFWGRSCEKIEPLCSVFTGKTWALKGDAFVYGQAAIGSGGTIVPVALAASESEATITKGTRTSDPNNLNIGIDNPQLATAPNTLDIQQNVNNITNATPMHTSIQPVLLTDCDVDYNSARTRGISHKIYTHFMYTWLDQNETITPFCGFGASVECAHAKCCSNSCKPVKYPSPPCCPDEVTTCNGTCTPIPEQRCADECCANCTLNQWAIWLKGGITFN